ncbi:MAG: ABC transporter ATP-binding protein, partial [Acidimicrobiaceae bacterium]|nr:ABC transporter ATP-binding protein [Acidimicrobiaceae bacterium]
VRSPDLETLSARLTEKGATVKPGIEGAVEVRGMDSAAIGELAAANRLVLHELTPQRASLEEVFMELTSDSVEFHANSSASPHPAEEVAR